MPVTHNRTTRVVLGRVVLSAATTISASACAIRRHVVGDDLTEHGLECTSVDAFTLANGNGACGLVGVSAGDEACGVGDDPTVIEEDVDVVPGRLEGADVAVQSEVGAVAAFDGFGNCRVGGVGQLADLLTDGLLPVRETADVGVDAVVG